MTTAAHVPVTPLAHVFDPTTLAAALADGHVRAQRHPELPLVIFPTGDGYAVATRGSFTSDQRVKIKYADYVHLHRLVFGLNARTVWEILVTGGDVADLVEPLPDEFHPWVHAIAAELTETVEAQATAIEAAYGELVAGLPDGWTRREFAGRAVPHPERGALFLRLDGKDYRPLLWQRARPAADRTPHQVE